MKKTFLILCATLSCSLFSGCGASTTSTNQKETNSETVILIEDAEQFSRITTDELKSLMGEPSSEEQWTNKTSKGNFDVLTWEYDKDSNHYEFIFADDSVVRVSIYSESYWNNTGNRFSFTGDKSSISKSFNVNPGDNVKKVTDNNFTYTLSPVNDKVAMFDVQDIDSDTYGFVKITYNLNYFD